MSKSEEDSLPKGIGDTATTSSAWYMPLWGPQRTRCQKALVTPPRLRMVESLPRQSAEDSLPKGIGDATSFTTLERFLNLVRRGLVAEKRNQALPAMKMRLLFWTRQPGGKYRLENCKVVLQFKVFFAQLV